MKKIVLGICFGFGVMMGFVAVAAVGISGKKASENMSVAEILDNLANAADEMRGKKVAANIVVSGASVKWGTELTYFYRVPNVGRGDVNRQIAAEKGLEIKREVCKDRMMRKAVDGGATIRYNYRNDRGHVLFEVGVDKGICEGLA